MSRRLTLTRAGVAIAVCAFAATPGATWAAPSGGSPSQVDIDLDLCGTTLGVLGQTLGSCDPLVPDEEPDDLLDDPLGDLLDGDLLGGELPGQGPLVDVSLAGQPVATVNSPGQDQLVELGLLRESDGVDDIAAVDAVDLGPQPLDGNLVGGSLLRGELGTAAVEGGSNAPLSAAGTLDLCGTSVAIRGTASAVCPTGGSATELRTCDAPAQLLGCSAPLGLDSGLSLCGIGVSVGSSFGTSCLADVPESIDPTTPTTSPAATPPTAPGNGGTDDSGSATGEGGDGPVAAPGADGGTNPGISGVGGGVGAGVPSQGGGLPVTGSSIGLLVVFAAALVISGLVAWKLRGIKIE